MRFVYHLTSKVNGKGKRFSAWLIAKYPLGLGDYYWGEKKKKHGKKRCIPQSCNSAAGRNSSHPSLSPAPAPPLRSAPSPRGRGSGAASCGVSSLLRQIAIPPWWKLPLNSGPGSPGAAGAHNGSAEAVPVTSLYTGTCLRESMDESTLQMWLGRSQESRSCFFFCFLLVVLFTCFPLFFFFPL